VPSHSEQRILPHTAEQLFDLVGDVGRYPEFLPWCVASRIISQGDNEMRAELAIGFKGIRERFISRVAFDRPNLRIDVTYEKGPFKYLVNRWRFEARDGGKCLLDFHVEFEFRSRLLEMLMGKLFDEAVRRMVRAFEERADALYGTNGGTNGAA
jgi:coenzyme Q-binding protein COQ10